MADIKGDHWITTKTDSHVKLDGDGNIKAGMGGTHTGKHISEIGKTAPDKTKKTELQATNDPIVTKTGMTLSEVKELVLEFEDFQNKLEKKYGKKANIQELNASEYKKYAEMATKLNSVPREFRDKRNPRRFDAMPEPKELVRKAEAGKDTAAPDKSISKSSLSYEQRKEALTGALKKLAGGSPEATMPNLRSDLEQFGGTNDVTLITGDEKKGLKHIEKRHGKEVIPGVLETVIDGDILRYVPENKTIILKKGNYEALLSLDEHGNKKTWLLSGWDVTIPKAEDAKRINNRAASDVIGWLSPNDTTQDGTIFSHPELGADNALKNILAQIFSQSNESVFSFNQRIQNWRVDDDGMLRVTAHILREGVYPYGPNECPDYFHDLPVVKQYIPAAEFTPESLATLEGKWVVVSEHEWRTDETTMADGLTVGSIAGTPRLTADGKAIECDMLIADREAIEAIERGKLVEVSAGYRSQLVKEQGEFEGVHYDAMQQGFDFNHVLLLPAGKGRCGSKVRIVNKKQTNGGAMAATFKVRIGNSDRTLRFTNEEDAAVAESAIEEEKKFNAEALAEHIAGREEVQAKLDEVNKQVTELRTQLAEHDKHLSEARAEIDRLLTPEAQEQLAEELNAQTDDEESIVEVEAENVSEEEKGKVLNSIRSGKTLAERRVNVANWHFENRKLEAPKDATQSYFDGLFVGLATAAREKIQNSARRVMNGKLPERTKTVNSGVERVMKSFYPKPKEA